MRAQLATCVCLATVLLAVEPSTAATDPLADAARELLAGRTDAALATLQTAEKSGGAAEVVFLVLRGSAYLEQGRFEEAIADFRVAHEKDAALSNPRLRLGDAFLRQKKWEEARAAYEEMMKQTNILILSERLRYAVLLTYLGAKDDAGATTALARLVFPTESPAYYYAQAAWAFAHGSNKAGVKWMKTADEIFDEKQTAWFARPLYDFGWIKTKPPLVLD